MKHTPGPWTVEAPYNLHMPYRIVTPRKIVATTQTDSAGVKATGPACKANAHLIAAAPELLASLEEAVQNCGCSFHERISGHKTDCRAVYWIDVIDKAKGGGQ